MVVNYHMFFAWGHINQWKTELFCKSLRTRKFSTGKFFGASTHGILTHSGFRKCIWKVGTTNFWPCLGRPKLGECDKMGSVSKIMSRPKKLPRPQFSKYRLQIESAWAHSLWAHADSIWSRYFENCGRGNFFERLIILLTDPILSHSPNFGRPKQGQKFVVPTFHIHFLNPECVRIPWLLASTCFSFENFRVQSD